MDRRGMDGWEVGGTKVGEVVVGMDRRGNDRGWLEVAGME